jgi:hypothetical protein
VFCFVLFVGGIGDVVEVEVMGIVMCSKNFLINYKSKPNYVLQEMKRMSVDQGIHKQF